MRTITIRRLQKEDFYNGFFESLQNMSPSLQALESETATKILEEREQAQTYTYVAVQDGSVVGTASLLIERKFIHNGSCAGYIEDVSVREGYQGNGIGRQLITRLIAVAKEHGCYKIILGSDQTNKGFYERLGFREHELHMRMDLS
ncbi:MAG: GNAT family N-acetyltransferase [Candidatus Dojkabacteria bacterium]